MRGSLYFLTVLFMFMFQGGLLATFIPEIIMVIAYLMCLFSPALTNSTPTTEHPNKKISIENKTVLEVSAPHTISYHSPIVNNQRLEFEVIHQQSSLIGDNRMIDHSSENPFLQLLEGLSYFQFSRPPPPFFLS